jgi:Glycosyltransferase family 87
MRNRQVLTPLDGSRVAGLLSLAVIVALAGLLGASAATAPVFLVPAAHESFPGWLAGPLAGLGPELSRTAFGAVLVVLGVAYLVVLGTADRLSARAVLATIASAAVLLALGPPLLSADVFGYLGYARLGVLHGIDPYAHGMAAAPLDAVRPYVRWADVPSPYGPAFTLATYALVPLGVVLGLWAFKLVAVLSVLALALIVRRMATRRGVPSTRAMALVALNPLVLVYGVGGAHNDVLVSVLVLAGVSGAVAGRAGRAGATVTLAAAIKASAGLALPFLILGVRDRRRAVVAAAAAAVGTVVGAALLFTSGAFGFVGAVVQQQRLAATHSVPGALGRLVGLGGITTGVRAVTGALLVLGIAAAFRRAWRGEDWIASAGWATLAVLLGSAWLLPWYVVWLLPLAAIARDRRLELAALAFCAFVLVGRIPATTWG